MNVVSRLVLLGFWGVSGLGACSDGQAGGGGPDCPPGLSRCGDACTPAGSCGAPDGGAAADLASPGQDDQGAPPDAQGDQGGQGSPQDMGLGAAEPGLNVLAGQPGGAGRADGTGTEARFKGPEGVALDGAGNLYVADTGNKALRKISLATGAVSTVLTIQGQATSLAVDAAGTIYFPDSGFYSGVLQVAPGSSTASVLAGPSGQGGADGPGAMASFRLPQGVALDGLGNLYVADTQNHTIRKIVTATGVVSTLAGTALAAGSADGKGAAARFQAPGGVAADAAGNVYVADTGSCTIRKIVAATADVTTVAGTAGMCAQTNGTGAAARFNRPGGLALDGAGNLYVADTFNCGVRKIVLATGAVTTLTGGTGCESSIVNAKTLWYPRTLAWAPGGILYVADGGNHAIRRVDAATGAITALAGLPDVPGLLDEAGPAARFNRPAALAADGAGNVFALDTVESRVRRIAVPTRAVTTLAGGGTGGADGVGKAAGFNGPLGLSIDDAGNLYVADTRSHTVRKIVIATGAVTTVAGKVNSLGNRDGTGTAALFNAPRSLVWDAGNLYVGDGDSGGSQIRKVVVESGVVTTVAGTSGIIASSIVADGRGSLYMTDFNKSTLRKLVLATGTLTTVAGSAGAFGYADGTGAAARFGSVQGLALDRAGDHLYAADASNHVVRKIVLATGQVSTVLGVAAQAGIRTGALPGGLNYPFGIAVLPNQALVVSSFEENTLLVAGGS